MALRAGRRVGLLYRFRQWRLKKVRRTILGDVVRVALFFGHVLCLNKRLNRGRVVAVGRGRECDYVRFLGYVFGVKKDVVRWLVSENALCVCRVFHMKTRLCV